MRYLAYIITLLVLFGCGSNSSNTNTQVIPTTQSLVGSYSLADISGTVWIGSILTDMNAANVDVSGALNLDDQGNFHYELKVTVTNNTSSTETTFTKEGIYWVDYTNSPVEGKITTLTNISVGIDDFTAFDKELIIDIDGVLEGGTYRAQETWLKESDTPVFPQG